MDLWIRSQQKEMLLKVNSSLIIICSYVDNHVYFIEFNRKKIAMYKTRRRALEILDDIEKFFTNHTAVRVGINETELIISNIYYMPKE